MSADDLTRLTVLIAVGLVWLLVNILAAQTWLKFISICGALTFLGAASWLALTEVLR